MSELSIAAVLTCFNRKDNTENCLDALFVAAQRLKNRIRLHVIVTDDGSSDGTGEMLINRFPQVEVLRGDGRLFWNGGMRLAFGRALQQGHDFYLWLNDDTSLFPDCLEQLLATHDALISKTGKSGLVVGSTCGNDGKVTYGGLYRPNPKRPLKFALMQPVATPQPCESCNGNCLLISAEAARQLGNLDAAYVHGLGDIDYGLRASEAGIPLWIMPGFAGKCDNFHPVQGSYLDRSLPFSVRWNKALSSKELSPRAWGVFCRRCAGPWWPIYWACPYIKVVLTSLIRERASSDRT